MITNEQATKLIEALKILNSKDKTIFFPKSGSLLKLKTESIDRRYKFDININRKLHRPNNPGLKLSIVAVYENVRLIAIDVNGQTHKNSESAVQKYKNKYIGISETVPCPHFHIFDEEFYNIAFPLPKNVYYGDINNVSDLITLFISFLKYFNVKNSNLFAVQPVIDEV